MLRSLDNFLHFHARTKRPLNTDGELTNATVFSAFAFKTNDSDSGQIVYDDSVSGNLSVTVSFRNSSCRNYTIEDFNEGLDFTGMSIERSDVNNNTVVVSFPSGFSIEVTPGIRLLQLSVSAPNDLMNNTEGLLGTFNGIKTDDLQYPNGTVISSNATEEEIFHLGQECKGFLFKIFRQISSFRLFWRSPLTSTSCQTLAQKLVSFSLKTIFNRAGESSNSLPFVPFFQQGWSRTRKECSYHRVACYRMFPLMIHLYLPSLICLLSLLRSWHCVAITENVSLTCSRPGTLNLESRPKALKKTIRRR